MLVFYSLVHSGERGGGAPTREWLEGTACQLMLHNLPLSFFLFSRLGCQKGKEALGVWGAGGGNGGTLVFLVVGFQAVIVCVAFYIVDFVIQYIFEIPA